MARVFLDTNILIDIVKRAREKIKSLDESLIFISPLSTHILFYSQKLNVPDEEIIQSQKSLGIIPLTKLILDKALQGPTSDLEDNIQLHSAAEAECDIFLTNDQKLLNMKFFGKTQILQSLNKNS